MLTKQSILLLVVSAFVVLPFGMAQAGNIDVQNGNMRTTIGQNDNIRVSNGDSEVIIKGDRTSSPTYRRSNRWRNNSRIRRRPVIVNPQVRRTQINCKSGTYSHQSSQTTVSNNGVTRTRSSDSTVCN